MSFGFVSDENSQLKQEIEQELERLKTHYASLKELEKTQPITNIEPPKPQVKSHLTTAKINGNTVIVTTGINDDDFTIFPIANPVNTSGRIENKETLQQYDHQPGQTSTMFSDKLSTGLIGGCVLILSMILTAVIVGGNKQNQPVYQPTPYTIETEDCEPSGFLWMGKTCKTRIERGIR